MRDIYIFSAGPGGRDVFQLLNDINNTEKTWNIKGYVDTDQELGNKVIDGNKVYHPSELQNLNLSGSCGICGVLDPHIREKVIQNEILPLGFNIPSLIHPSSIIANDFEPQTGLLVFSGVNISYNVKIERHVLISFNSLVGHDGKIGEFSSLLPSSVMDGKCEVGSKSIIGSGAILHPGIIVGSNSIVGIGSVILDKVPDNVTIAQLPRTIKLNR